MRSPHLEVVPAILAKSTREFREKLRAIERAAPLVQIDVMDGKFVPNTTWADPAMIGRWRTPTQFEVHLMVREPIRAVMAWGKVRRVRRIIVHAESARVLPAVLAQIFAQGKEVGLAVNPGTTIRDIVPRVPAIDFLMVMANEPGFSGRPFRKSTLRRITTLHRRFPNLPIGVDIGVSMETAPLLRRAGATHIAAASAVFGAPNPVAAYRALERAFLEA